MATEKIPLNVPESGREPQAADPGAAPVAVQANRRRASDRGGSILVIQTVVAISVVGTVLYFTKLVMVTLLVAILLAFILEPLVGFFQRIKIPREIGALLALLIFVACLTGVTYKFYSSAVSFAQDLPKYSGKIKAQVGRLREKAQRLQKTTENVIPKTKDDQQTVKVEQQTNWSDFITKSLGTVGEIVLTVSFIPFLVYFMLSWQEHVRAATVMLFKMENRNTAYVTLGRISAMVRSFINGNLMVGLFTSFVSVGIFWYLHLPYFYFLGFISGFLSLIPYLGVILAMVPPLIAGLGQLHSGGLLTIVFSVLGLHMFSINVLFPKFVGKRLQLNPLAVTIALLLWGWLWGAMGLILAVPITAGMKIVFDNVESLRAYGAWLGE
jgi:predicted PurR-regulated permease PerM